VFSHRGHGTDSGNAEVEKLASHLENLPLKTWKFMKFKFTPQNVVLIHHTIVMHWIFSISEVSVYH